MIISASRRTDIPAYFSEWFMNRIYAGYAVVRNPLNANQLSKVYLTPDLVDCIVFWTKNPVPIIPRLDELKDFCYYFQFTLTGYDKDIERNLPDKKEVLLPAFKELADKIGPERVIWRYDPILINDRYSSDWHLETVKWLSDNLKGYTEKCVFSYVDYYKKIDKNLNSIGIKYPTDAEKKDIAIGIRDIVSANGMVATTCAENIELDGLGINHNACIDKALVERLTGGKIKNTKKNLKDAAQRPECGCMPSKEIGAHNTCSNGCIYCYANFSPDSVKKSMARYDPKSEILCDVIGPDEVVKDAADQNKLVQIDGQMSMFDFIGDD
ncbi:protein of unknown function [Lachnospiraceae bacterium NE2001]|nr:protein of unknown function [Lachnospiraceae bacterium NE2001]